MSRRNLIEFRDHARQKSQQTDYERPTRTGAWCATLGPDLPKECDGCTEGPEHCACTCHDDDREPPPTEAERELWKRLADEMDAHLGEDA